MRSVLVVSDFNAELVSRYLSAASSEAATRASVAPFGQVFQTLGAAPDSSSEGQALFVWTRPEGVLPSWQRCLDGRAVDIDELFADVDAFADAVSAAAAKHPLTMVATWVRSRTGRGLGMLDWGPVGLASRLARMNIRLTERLSTIPGVVLFDTQRWLDVAPRARDSKSWFLLKCPFSDDVCKAAAQDIAACLRNTTGRARKLLVLDLDNTVWGGVVGELGWQGVRLGGHDAIGEAFVDFQRAALSLSHRGIALAIVSKNDEAVAMEAIDKHEEMVIRRNDLAGWRINWDDKAANIVALTSELNLGLDAVVFVDDNPAERGRVREALPQVLVPEWPASPLAYADALLQLDCFDQVAITDEDRQRTAMYAAERQRREESHAFSTPDEWLRTLGVRVQIAPVGPQSIQRVTQLLNKTNQMNLATRRLTEAELHTWLAGGTHRQLFSLTVADRFGDLGLTGVISWESVGDELRVVDFLLSCRAMGRRVEETMAAAAVDAARRAGLRLVRVQFLRTDRNRPCLQFWQQSAFEQIGDDTFVWDTSSPLPYPETVALELDAAGDR